MEGGVSDMGSVSANGPEIRETGTSFVFLVGDLAFKVKKPVDLGFLDFTTVEQRGQACAEEVRLNRRLSPDVYLDHATLTSSDDQVMEHLVVMRRMPDHRRLSAMLTKGQDVDDHVREIARMLATFHSKVAGDAEANEVAFFGLRKRWDDNLAQTEHFTPRLLPADWHEEIAALAREYIDGRLPLLCERASHGLAVEGHADLLAEDIFCLPDHPRIIDCLEFDRDLRFVDVLDDAAFLAMDMERLGRPDVAGRFLRWYDEFSGATSVQSLEHHYIAYRAFVRAKVALIKAELDQGDECPLGLLHARLALEHLRAARVRLILIGGGPATGKSTVARMLADSLGAMLLLSDVVRRELSLDEQTRYTPEGRAAAYRAMLAHARNALERGETVILDATWASREDRARAQDLATATHTASAMFECRVPRDVAVQRAALRQAQSVDESEAGPSEVLLLRRRDAWPDAEVLDTTRAAADVVATALQCLRQT